MKCFFRYCSADLDPVIPDGDVPIYPMHFVQGPADWYGICPASMMPANWGDRTPADSAKIVRHTFRLQDEHNRRIEQATRAYDELHGTPKGSDPRFGIGTGPVGEPPSRPRDEYFPERPGDPGERAPGDAQIPPPVSDSGHLYVPINDDLTLNLKGQPMDDMRSQLKALVHLTKQGLDQMIERGHTATDEIGDLNSSVQTISLTMDSTLGLARAAVGGGQNLPEAAGNMLGSLLAAKSTLDEAEAALTRTMYLLSTVADSIRVAKVAADEYSARL